MEKKSKKKAGPYCAVRLGGYYYGIDGPGLGPAAMEFRTAVLWAENLNTAYAAGQAAARKKGDK